MKRTFPLIIAIVSTLFPHMVEGQAARGSRKQNTVVEGTTYTRPQPTSKPVFLRDTIEVQLQTKETYWKFPNQNYYTSWVPRASFQVFYDGSTVLRYTAEWFNPDGSTWFTESLRSSHNGNDIAQLTSEWSEQAGCA